MKKKVLLIAVAMSVMLADNVLAADNNLKSIYKPENNTLVLSGSSQTGDELLITIMPKWNSDYSVEALNNGAVFDMLTPESDGTFTAEIILPNYFDEGLYKVIASYGDVQLESVFSYISVDDNVLESINGAKSKLDIVNIIKQEFGSEYADEIGGYIYSIRAKNGFSSDELLKGYTASYAFYSFVNGDNDLSSTIEMFSEYMDIDRLSDYENYSDDVKSEIEKLFKAGNPEDETVGKFYDKCVVLAQINCAETAASLKTIIEVNFGMLSTDTTDYDGLTDYKKGQVFGKMVGKKYSSFANVNTAFETAVNSVKNQVNQSSGSSSGGGGGGGGAFISAASSSSGSGNTANTNTTNTNTSDANNETTSEMFSDTAGHWAAEEIKYLSEKNIIDGFPDGSFKPEANITRAEFAKLFCVAFGIDAAGEETMFTDVSTSDWYCGYVNALAKHEIILGFDDGNFYPGENILRQDAATILWRYLSADATPTDTEPQSYDDSDKIADYAAEAIQNISKLNIMSGYDQKFFPEKLMTRAEASKIIYETITQ